MCNKEIITPNSSDSSSDCSSDQEEPPRKRQRLTSSRDLEERFDILSHSLVSHLNNILTANFATSTETPPLNMQMPSSYSNSMPHT